MIYATPGDTLKASQGLTWSTVVDQADVPKRALRRTGTSRPKGEAEGDYCSRGSDNISGYSVNQFGCQCREEQSGDNCNR